jgi:hypothetical protein
MLLQTLIAFYSDGWWNIIVIAITQEYRLKSSVGICCFVRWSFQIGFPFWQKRSRTSSTGNNPDGFISFFLFCRLSGSIFKQKRRRAACNASFVYFCASVLSTERKTVSDPRASDARQPVPNVSCDFERCWRILLCPIRNTIYPPGWCVAEKLDWLTRTNEVFVSYFLCKGISNCTAIRLRWRLTHWKTMFVKPESFHHCIAWAIEDDLSCFTIKYKTEK